MTFTGRKCYKNLAFDVDLCYLGTHFYAYSKIIALENITISRASNNVRDYKYAIM
jgi:hypothetical protein